MLSSRAEIGPKNKVIIQVSHLNIVVVSNKTAPCTVADRALWSPQKPAGYDSEGIWDVWSDRSLRNRTSWWKSVCWPPMTLFLTFIMFVDFCSLGPYITTVFLRNHLWELHAVFFFLDIYFHIYAMVWGKIGGSPKWAEIGTNVPKTVWKIEKSTDFF